MTGQFVAPAAPLTVSALVARIKEALLDAFPQRLAVVGQISNFKRHSSGHLYFSLKDDASAMDAVMWRTDAASVRFDIADGLEVVAEGRLDIFQRTGRLQMYVQRLTPQGAGALELAFRQMKERLEREGLFDAKHKVPPPRFPRGIGLITSPTGAAVRDIERTLRRRWPAANVYLLPVPVQGEGAAAAIAAAIAQLDSQAKALGIDTIILARGGGSLEDLWAFNEEVVARAIFNAATPIICGVGHEVDFTIADFVADVRAATPTAAAELAVPDRAELVRAGAALAGRLGRGMRQFIDRAGVALLSVQRSVVFRDPRSGVRTARQQVDELTSRLRHGLRERGQACERRLAQTQRALVAHSPRRLHERASARLAQARARLAWELGRRLKLAADALARRAGALAGAHPQNALALARQKCAALARQLEAMSHRAVLARGFSVTRRAGGGIITTVAQAPPGTALETELVDGKLRSQVTGESGPPARAAPRKHKADEFAGPTLFGEVK